MPIVVSCPGCRTRLTFGPDRAGWTVDCPKCGAAVAVPGGVPEPPPRPVPSPPAASSDSVVTPLAAWLAAVAVACAALFGIAGVLGPGRDNVKKLEEELAALENASAYDPVGETRHLKERARNAIEMDTATRRQAVANVAFAALFVCAAFATAGVFAGRPPSLYQGATLWGSLAGACLGLFGAALSQFAPLWATGLVNRAAPGTAHQLTFLASHTLLGGVVGIAFGAGAAILRSRAERS